MAKADTIYLARHAKAGERRVWEGDDTARPLSKAGWKQAELLGKRLHKAGATSLYSSPYVRCRQTLEPLGKRLGVGVHDDDRLFEGNPFEPVLDLLTEVPAGAVLCSHGDIVPEVVAALHRRGMDLCTPVDWRKATVWVLKRKGDRIVQGKVWPPPS